MSADEDDALCPCGLQVSEHKIFFAGMATNKPISIDEKKNKKKKQKMDQSELTTTTTTTTSGKVSNLLVVCSHPDMQIKSYNRERKWQILVGPFIDSRADDFIRTCQRQSRKPIPRLLRMIKLAIEYNKTLLREGETKLTVYLVGDISSSDVESTIV